MKNDEDSMIRDIPDRNIWNISLERKSGYFSSKWAVDGK